jgi:hypothetical protein
LIPGYPHIAAPPSTFQFCSEDFTGGGTMIFGGGTMIYCRMCPSAKSAFDGKKIPGEFPENRYKSFTSGRFTSITGVAFRRRNFVPAPGILRSEIARFGVRA